MLTPEIHDHVFAEIDIAGTVIALEGMKSRFLCEEGLGASEERVAGIRAIAESLGSSSSLVFKYAFLH
ncbi:MAG: hypothetical protein ACI8UO_002090 [Verrucomicrobiales bacterium]|jgi:hypothetical protein